MAKANRLQIQKEAEEAIRKRRAPKVHKKKVLGKAALTKSSALTNPSSVAYYDAWRPRKRKDNMLPLKTRVNAIVHSNPAFARTVQTLDTARSRVRRRAHRALVKSSSGDIKNYLRVSRTSSAIPDFENDDAVAVLTENAKAELDAFFGFDTAHVCWSHAHEVAFETYKRENAKQLSKAGAASMILRLAAFLLSKEFMDTHTTVLGHPFSKLHMKKLPSPRAAAAPQSTKRAERRPTPAGSPAAIHRARSTSPVPESDVGGSLRDDSGFLVTAEDVALRGTDSPRVAQVSTPGAISLTGTSMSKATATAGALEALQAFADMGRRGSVDVEPRAPPQPAKRRNSIVIGEVQVYAPKGSSILGADQEILAAVGGGASGKPRRRSSFAAASDTMAKAAAAQPKRGNSLAQVFSRSQRRLAQDTVAEEIVEKRAELVERFRAARHEYLRHRLDDTKQQIRKRDAAYAREIELAYRRQSFRRDYQMVRFRLRELFGPTALAAMDRQAPRGASQGPTTAAPQRQVPAAPSARAEHRAATGQQAPKSKSRSSARRGPPRAATLQEYREEKLGMRLDRMFALASGYGASVAQNGGGAQQTADARAKAKKKLKSDAKWAVKLIERAFRGHIARKYVWALRYISREEVIRTAFHKADADGNLMAEPRELYDLIRALGGQYAVDRFATSKTPTSRRVSITKDAMTRIFESIGLNEDGLVACDDFIVWWRDHLPWVTGILEQLAVVQTAKMLRTSEMTDMRNRDFEEQAKVRRAETLKLVRGATSPTQRGRRTPGGGQRRPTPGGHEPPATTPSAAATPVRRRAVPRPASAPPIRRDSSAPTRATGPAATPSTEQPQHSVSLRRWGDSTEQSAQFGAPELSDKDARRIGAEIRANGYLRQQAELRQQRSERREAARRAARAKDQALRLLSGDDDQAEEPEQHVEEEDFAAPRKATPSAPASERVHHSGPRRSDSRRSLLIKSKSGSRSKLLDVSDAEFTTATQRMKEFERRVAATKELASQLAASRKELRASSRALLREKRSAAQHLMDYLKASDEDEAAAVVKAVEVVAGAREPDRCPVVDTPARGVGRLGRAGSSRSMRSHGNSPRGVASRVFGGAATMRAIESQGEELPADRSKSEHRAVREINRNRRRAREQNGSMLSSMDAHRKESESVRDELARGEKDAARSRQQRAQARTEMDSAFSAEMGRIDSMLEALWADEPNEEQQAQRDADVYREEEDEG